MTVKKKASKSKLSPFYASPLYDFLTPFRPAPNQWVARYIIIIFAVIIRSAVGLGSFSGFGIPPMHGDFEAQRHWMELTIHLPIKKWYYYDLQYWGLDYPPLTAFHSWVLGMVGQFIYPPWFALDVSRGSEDPDLKSFMRATAILSECLFYIPGVIYFTRWMGKRLNQSPIDQTIAAAAILFQPSLILIDHGHFQFNSVMLGLTLLSIVNLLHDNYVLASIFFTCSIFFKQMALYYAPFIFAYLLSKSIWPLKKFNILRLIAIGVAVLVTTVLTILPFVIFGELSQLNQILFRVFPFGRGLFEDKVANFWCATNTLIKYKNIFSNNELQKISFALTLLSILPPCVMIFLYPNKKLLSWGFALTAWGFYLFSFQVHEKSVLVPLMPTTLLYSENDPNVLAMISWINNVAVFSLWPLLEKDGLALQYIIVSLLANWLNGSLDWITIFFPKFLIPGQTLSVVNNDLKRNILPRNWFWKITVISTTVLALVIHVVDIYYPAPEKYPDLWVIANATLSFGCFSLFWLWSFYKMFSLRNAVL